MSLPAIPPLPPVDARRRLRRSMRYQQGELAKELGVTRETVSRWEQGHQEPSGLAGRRYALLLAEWSRAET